MSRRNSGRHELGQNFLTNPKIISSIVDTVQRWPRELQVVEYGPGAGAISIPLAATGRDLVLVEVDRRHARRLAERLPQVAVIQGDLMQHRLDQPTGVVSNVPFHLTTPLLRKLLGDQRCRRALLLVQWEVARKRAAIGHTTQLTAQWWPWLDFALRQRVPADAFRPRPNVDGGLLEMTRLDAPLISWRERAAYQTLVTRIFQGRGRGVHDIAARVVGRETGQRRTAQRQLSRTALPRDLGRDDWIALYRLGNDRVSGPNRQAHIRRT